MIFTAYFLVGDRPQGIIVDLLYLIKFLLYLVELHKYIFLLSLVMYLGVTIGICSSYMLSQCIKQNLQLSYFAMLIISYPTHYFTFGIIFCMCAGYRVGI